MKSTHHITVLLAIISLSIGSARATLRQWTGGGADNNWTAAANWGGTAPVAGDDLVFPATNLRLNNTNNFAAGTVFNSITISGTNYVINGNAITNNAGFTNSSPVATTNTFNCPLTLGGNQSFVCTTNTSLVLNGTLNVNGKLFTFDSSGFLFVNGVLSGPLGNFTTKASAGALVLTATNTYAASISVTGGRLIVKNGAALGATSANTAVSTGASLEFENNITVAEQITVSGSGVVRNLSGTNALTGNMAVSLAAQFTVETNSSLILSNIISSAGGLNKYGPGTLTLTGNSNNTYSGTTTVNEGTLLLSKPAGVNAIPLGSVGLVIGDGLGGAGADIVRLANSNQIPNSLAVTINSSGLLALNGKDETIGPLTLNTFAQVDTSAGTLTLNGNLTFTGASVGESALIQGHLSLGGVSRTFTDTNGFLSINASIIDGGASAGITKMGAGSIQLNGTNSFSGPVIVAEGLVQLVETNGLGASGGGVVVSNGATLSLECGGTVAESSLTIFGTLSCDFDTILTGTISLGSSNTVFYVDGGSELALSGVVTNTGGLLKTGEGDLTFFGSLPNTYSGITIVTDGTLNLDKPSGVTAVPGPLLIFGAVGEDQDNQIADTAPVTLGSFDALLSLLFHSETIGSLSGINLGTVSYGPGTLTVGGDNSSTTFNGQIIGNGSLIKAGTGTFTLSGSNSTFTAPIVVSAGTLLVNGKQSSTAVSVTGGTLGGTGSVGTITATAGSVSPGASPGLLNSSNVVLSSVSFNVELNGTNAGVNYDQLNVTGTVNLASCALNVSLGFTPAGSNKFTILANDSTDAITGTFASLTEGTYFSVSGTTFRITYQGGSGNDVVLQRTNAPPSTISSVARQTNDFVQLQGLGLAGLTYAIEAASNLTPVIQWTPLGTATANGSGVFTFTDTNAPLFTTRFYRCLSP